MKKIITCTICKKTLSGKQTKFCSPKCRNKSLQSYPSQQIRGLKRKRLLVKLMGGCCSICGYSKNFAALTFHHLNPKKKSFQLDLRSLSNRKMSRIDSEMKKCVLVCQNCHTELHNPQHNLEWTFWAACSTTELWSQFSPFLCLGSELNWRHKDFPVYFSWISSRIGLYHLRSQGSAKSGAFARLLLGLTC